jgi:hypothetical protein
LFQLQLLDTRSGARRSVPVVGRTFLIGSAIDCDLVLPGDCVAPHQCRLELDEGQLRVVDLGTHHDTLVNDRAISIGSVHVGDVVRIGVFQLAVLPDFAREVAHEVVHDIAHDVEHEVAPIAARAESSAPRPAVRAAPPAPAFEPRAARPRPAATSSSSAAAVMGMVAVAAVIALAVHFFGNSGDGRDEVAAAQRRRAMETAIELDVACRFDEALAALAPVVRDAKGPEREQALAQEREIKARQERCDEGMLQLARLQARAKGEADPALRDDVERFLAGHGDLIALRDPATKPLARFDPVAKKPAAASDPLDRLDLPSDPAAARAVTEADEWYRQGDFGRAHRLLARVTVVDEEDTRRLTEALARVDAAARKEADVILHRVALHLDKREVLQALAELEEPPLARLRGTDAWYELLDKADEVEDAIDATIPDHARPQKRRLHHREPGEELLAGSGEPSAKPDEERDRERDGGAPPRAGDAPAKRNSAADASGRATLEQARALMAAGDFAQALHLLDLALDGATDPELKQEIARDHERAARPQKLIARLAELLATKLPANPDATLRDGRSGRITGSDGRLLTLEVGGSVVVVEAGELSLASLLKLSGRYPLTGEEQLHRAFLALAARDDALFFAALAKVGDDPALSGPLFSALAFQRGLERVPARGFVRVGEQWLTWEEHAQFQLAGEVRGALAALLAPDPKKPADPAAARTAFLELAAATPVVALAEVKARRAALSKAFLAAPEQARLAKLRERAVALRDARKHALQLIFDEGKYFYPYSPPGCPPDKAALYPAVQQEVDLRVEAVRAIWGREGEEAPEPQIALSAATQQQLEQLRALRQLLADLGSPSDAVDDELKGAWALPLHARAVHLRNFALDDYERSRLDQDVRVWALNAAVVERDGGADREEIEQVRVTNQYRAMLGRRVLAFNERLWVAADGHSEWMARTGRLSHFEDGDPERNSPEQRMRLAGYKSGAGENCAMGRMGALEALHGWCHSSGHHRNLLFESHTEMGSGQSGSFWTQCFGGGSEYKGNLIHD